MIRNLSIVVILLVTLFQYGQGSSLLRRNLQITSPEQNEKIDEEGVRSLFFLWNQALQTGDSSIVVKRYSKDAVLLPTVSDTPRTSTELIKEYFDTFLLKLPSGKILSGDIMIGDKWAQDVGIYEFSFGADGSRVTARYTYVYVYENGFWKISQHHSSVLPESVAFGVKTTEEEVRSLFTVWNTALATLDPDTVTNLYAADGVLLPTVSDTPRTNHALIKEYFNAFLLKKPQGVILESYVDIGTNWAQDVGIYEFTFGSDGSKVKARYSYVYSYVDGEWKIQHHHSSVLPEAILSLTARTPIKQLEIRGLFSKWNDALQSGNASAVTALYTSDAIILPADSVDTLNTTESINEYYEKFLLKKPSAEIEYGEIRLGYNWAQDAGVYIFTFAEDNTTLQERYTMIYMIEDDEWKISDHQSSLVAVAAE